ncbi:MAG TPA: TIGR01458 family HAD-type hydrolase [Actinomycetota bacterium]
MPRFEGILLDIDGVLVSSWRPLPGGPEAVDMLRREEIPFRLITNTTTHTRNDLAKTLAAAGIDVAPNEIVTAVVAAAAHLRNEHPNARAFVLCDGDARDDLEGVEIVEDGADVIVLGGAYEGFDYPTLNHVFRMLMDGAELVAMHRNLYWRTDEGWRLDGGAYVAGLEEATGRRATVCGKPAKAYFASALSQIGVPPERAAMVGDDVENDVLAAQAVGLTGVLVRTGKFRREDLERADGRPDVILDSALGLPNLLATS